MRLGLETGVALTAITLAAVGVISRCPHRSAPLIAVSNEDSGDVSFIDPKTDALVATIPVGKRPRGMRVAPDRQFLYVAVSGSAKKPPGSEDDGAHDDQADGIAVIDLEKRAVVRTLHCGRDPEAFDLTPDGKRLFVSNEDAAEVSEVDIASGTVVRSIPVGREPEGVTYSNGEIFVTSEGDARVDVIDDREHRVVRSISTPKRPRAVAFHGAEGFVTSENEGVLAVIDHDRLKSSIALGPNARPMGIAVDGDHAYVSNGRGKSISVIDLDRRSVVGAVDDVGARPWGLAAVGDKLYVAAGPDVAVVSISQRATLTRIRVGTGPWGVISVPSAER